MGEEETNLAANFPSFIDVIEQSGLDYRIAVTSTSVDYAYTITTQASVCCRPRSPAATTSASSTRSSDFGAPGGSTRS